MSWNLNKKLIKLFIYFNVRGDGKMNTRFSVIGIITILIAIGLCGCTGENALSGLEYSNTQYGFGLNPPQDWIIDENDPYGAIVRFSGPTEDEFTVNLGINGPSTLNEGETLNSSFQEIIASYTNMFTNFFLISSRDRTVNGMNGYEIVYTFTQGIFQAKSKQVGVEKDGYAFVLTFVALVDNYDEYNSIIEQSINSFMIA